MPASVRLAIRSLAKTPGITAIVVLTLALGLGATTAIYSVVNGVLLRPFAFREPGRLFFLGESIPGSGYGVLPVSARHFTEWRGHSASFESLSAVSGGSVSLTGKGEPERLEEMRVSANLFTTLGVQPAIGRGFLPDEDHPGKDRVAVLGNQFWQRNFHADPGIIGSTILLDNEAYTVVGVLPAWFHFPNAHALLSYYPGLAQPDLFRPMVFSADDLGQLMGNFNYGAIGRLRTGVDRQAAETELTGICAQLSRQSGQKVDLRAVVTPFQEAVVGKARLGLLVLMGAVGAVLLIICVNLASLLLVRAEGRAVDSAIRLALGASRFQLLRQSLIETLLMALLGGTLGLPLAASVLRFLLQVAPPDIPRLDEVRLDGGVLLFAVALTSLTGVIFGLGPAWRAASSDPQGILKSRGRTLAGEGRRMRNALVVVESGLSAALLILAGLLLASFSRLVHVPTGFAAPTVLAADLSIPWNKYREPAQRNAFFEHVVTSLASSPGVASAAITSALPLKGETWVDNVWLPGDSRPVFDRPSTNVRFVSPEYFRTMGIPLLAGRTLALSDRERKVAVISERLAQTLWPGANAIGRSFDGRFGTYEVIGIVGDVRADAHKSAVPIFYHPYWDWPPLNATIVARAVGNPRSIAQLMRQAVASVDPDVPVPSLVTMQEVLDDSLSQRHFQAILGAVFAATALLLAALGIYGVVSYSVLRRTNEIGIRAALGAQPSDLRWMVVSQGLAPVYIGLLGGIAAALALGRVLGGLLFEIRPDDPTTIATVALIMLTTAAAACLLPARRATQVDPVEALRSE
jgi:putative ABC transport system permease protein